MNGDSLNDGTQIELHPPEASLMVYDELVRLKEEVASLQKCVRKIAMVSAEALSRTHIRIPSTNE